jgi:transcriptional regulator EpsA
MEQPVILSKLEQEYLLRAIEAAVQVRDVRQLFLWAQGQLQALLPHQLLAAMQFGHDGALLRIEAVHGNVLDGPTLQRLCDPRAGLAPRLAAWCNRAAAYPCMGERGGEGLPAFQDAIDACGYANLLAQGSGPMPGGATVFVLFGLPQRPGPRQAYFLELLLPYLHMALLRAATPALPAALAGQGAARRLSAREIEILGWLREGKSNADIAAILGLSSLTVKNHLQRIYRSLAVSNRTQAVARGTALRLVPALACVA